MAGNQSTGAELVERASRLRTGENACRITLLRAALERSDLESHARVETLLALGTALLALPQADEAGSVLDDALRRADALGDVALAARVRVALGSAAQVRGDLNAAGTWWERAADDFARVGEKRAEADAIDALATVRLNVSDRPVHERALALGRACRDPRLQARAHLHWARALLASRSTVAAIDELERADGQLVLVRPDDPITRADVEATLADALWQRGAIDDAAAHHRAAAAIQARTGDRAGLLASLAGLAAADAAAGRLLEARHAAERALAVARLDGDPAAIGRALSAQGWIALEQGDAPGAQRAFGEAVSLPADDVAAAFRYAGLGDAYREQAQLTSARDAVTRALTLARAAGNDLAEASALLARARLLDAEEHRAEALADAHAVLAVLAHAPAPPERQQPSDGRPALRERAWDAIVDLLESDNQADLALDAAEQARADAVRVPDETAGSDGVRVVVPLGEPPPVAEGTTLVEPPARARGPSTRARDGSLVLPQVIATAARLHSTVLEYWIGQRASYAWVVTADGRVRSRALPARAAGLAALVARATTRSRTNDDAAWGALYAQLVKPIEEWLPAAEARLTIVPHGPLVRLSFAGLRDARGRYLVERYALHYLPSATAAQVAGVGARRGCLLVADPAPVPAVHDERLAVRSIAGRGEVLQVARLVGADRCTVFTGSGAEEGLVRAQLAAAGVIHLATPALVDAGGGHGPFVLLGTAPAGAADPAHDGRFTVSEIEASALSADLVVLSACRRSHPGGAGAGMAGLADAFLAAGASTVVAALWDPGEPETTAAIARFYKERQQGRAADDALRRAQLARLAELRRSAGGASMTPSPAAWASLVVTGTP